MLIYLLTNEVNGKQYVGQTTTTLCKRMNWYKIHATNGRKTTHYVVYAMRKYGFENFDVDVLRECASRAGLDYWERYYIRTLGTMVPKGYNVQGGGRVISAKNLREAFREKMILERYKKEKVEKHVDEIDLFLDEYLKEFLGGR